MIYGATRFCAFCKIALPLAALALLVVTLFAFTNAWNEFLFTFVFITSQSLRTLPIGPLSMVAGDIPPWGQHGGLGADGGVGRRALHIYAQRFLAERLTVARVKG